MMEEGARAGADGDLAAVAGDVEPVEGLHRRFRLTLGGAERGEIVPADERLGGAVHGVRIERAGDVPDTAGVERRRRPAVADPVEIVARGRRETGIEARTDGLGRQHDDRRGAEMGVQRVADRVGRPVAT